MQQHERHQRIGIVGGGPGGLTLARILATRGISSTVFELDEHPLARPQGGSLDLHAESGLLALRHAGLLPQFEAVARYEDQAGCVLDIHGTIHLEEPDGSDGERPEIDRTQLRAILLESLEPGVVRWGSKVQRVEPLADGKHRVVGDRGALGDFDLVVGADGAWSKVRPLVSDARPAYSGVTLVELGLDDVDAQHPAIAKLVDHGKIFAVGVNQGLIAQRNSHGHVRVYAMFRVPDDWIANGALDLSTPARARVDLKRHLEGWAPSLLALIDASNDAIVPRPLVALPVGHRWAHRPGVTLLGDAAHVMSPFSGEGVNMAMLDAAELALALASEADGSRAVAGYEERMFARARDAAAGAAAALDGAIAEDGLAHVLEVFRSMQPTAAAGVGAGVDDRAGLAAR
jgi:2-polyprenyl-6-methoxyphenol hydroxylase-like FAD-dependent oxidoreductase